MSEAAAPAAPSAPTEAPAAAEPMEAPATTATLPTEDTSLNSTTEAPATATPDPFADFAKAKAAGEQAPTQTAEATPAEEVTPGDWKDALPDQYRSDNYLNRFQSMEEFLKGVKNLQNLASKKGLERPAEDAPPEAWNDYWETVGRPTNPEDYTIDNIKDSTGADVFEFDAEAVAELRPEFHKRGFTNDQAQFVMERFAQMQMAKSSDDAAAKQAEIDSTITNLQAEYKDTYEANVKRSLSVLENLGLYDTMVKHGLEHNEAFIRAGIKLSQEFGEATVGPRGSVKDTVSRLHEIEGSKAFNDARDPNHKRAVQERNELLKIYAGG